MATLTLLLQLLSLATISLFLLTNASLLVDNVCGRQTPDRRVDLCKKFLTFDPRSETAPPPLLAEIAVDLAGYIANAIKQTIHDSLIRAVDPTVHGQYVHCENLYVDALDELFRTAQGAIKNNQWSVLARLGVTVRRKIDRCEAVFNNNSSFRSRSQVVGVLADAVTAIARNL